MSKKIIDIKDRQQSYEELNHLIWRTELGLRAVAVMYDEHSSDQYSKDNIYRLKENIFFRLQSTLIQYRILLEEYFRGEKRLNNLFKEDPQQLFVEGYNVHFEKINLDIASIFDGIIFQAASVFDYFSHYISYMLLKNKCHTMYWTNLAKASRGKENEICVLKIKEVIKEVDNKLIGRLYDYRSNLIHNKLDPQKFSASVKLSNNGGIVNLQICISKTLLKKFKVYLEIQDQDVSIVYFSEILIKEICKVIEQILDGLIIEIKSDSHYSQNLIKPKRDSVMFAFAHPETHTFMTTSDHLWQQYKQNK